ncbi:MAG: hypothetical protein R3E89_18150 [Thiolinea sp.]
MLKPEHIRALRQNGFLEMVLISFDATTLQRGVHYFETRHVIELSSEVPSLSEVRLSATVLGTRKYSTQVTIDLNRHKVFSSCSCAVGSQCKHGVAALLQYVGSQVTSPSKTVQAVQEEPSAVQLWLADLNTRTSKKTSTPEQDADNANRMDLIYILDQNNKSSNRVDVAPRKAARLKRGGYGQGYHVQLEDLLYSWKTHTFQHTPLDVDITQLIIPHTSYYDSNSRHQLALKGGLGKLALGMLLQTGRCFWHKTESAPLKSGPARVLEFHWDERNQARHLLPRVAPAIQDYFWLDELHYVDLLRGECGVLEHAPCPPNRC